MGIEPVTLYVHGDTGRRSGFLPAVLILKHYKMTFQEENTAGLNLLQVERGSNLFFFKQRWVVQMLPMYYNIGKTSEKKNPAYSPCLITTKFFILQDNQAPFVFDKFAQ